MSAPRRFLLSRTDRLGDLILATPVATALKQHLPGAEVHFLASSYAAEILTLHPHVDGVIARDDHGRPITVQQLSARLRSFDFEAVLALFPRPELAWAFVRAGIPMRIGTGYRWYSLLFTHRLFEHRKHAGRHEAEYNLQLLRPLGVTHATVTFHHRFTAHDQQQVAAQLAAHGLSAPFVILHPGSGGSARDWPLDHFAALADHLVRQRGVPVVLTGTSAERSLTREICRLARVALFDFAGALSLRELAVLIARAAVFVGNSTGPLHLARMVGTPVVAFYPPITACRPERWGPYGCRADVLMSQEQECFKCRKSAERYCDCMRAIPVAAALARVEEKLAQRAV